MDEPDESNSRKALAALTTMLERKQAGVLSAEEERRLNEITLNVLTLMADALGESQPSGSK